MTKEQLKAAFAADQIATQYMLQGKTAAAAGAFDVLGALLKLWGVRWNDWKEIGTAKQYLYDDGVYNGDLDTLTYTGRGGGGLQKDVKNKVITKCKRIDTPDYVKLSALIEEMKVGEAYAFYMLGYTASALYNAVFRFQPAQNARVRMFVKDGTAYMFKVGL